MNLLESPREQRRIRRMPESLHGFAERLADRNENTIVGFAFALRGAKIEIASRLTAATGAALE